MIFNFNSKTEITHSFDDNVFTKLTTVVEKSGSIGTINGTGYIILRKTWGNNNNTIQVYIDGNTTAFYLMPTESGGVQDGYYRFYFQKSIRFAGSLSEHEYFYQTLLTETPVADKYVITQGSKTGDTYLTFTGKGKVLLSGGDFSSMVYFKVDGGSEKSIAAADTQGLELWFTKSIAFKASGSGTSYPLYYILYLEVE